MCFKIQNPTKAILTGIFLFLIIHVTAQEDHKLIITHPTISTLERVDFLIRDGIFPIDKNMELILLYHSSEKYDYENSRNWLDTAGMCRAIQWMPLDCPLNQKSIFSDNHCSNSFRSLLRESKGIIFFGGPDIPPAVYGEEMSLLTEVTDPNRHYWETSLLFHLLGGARNPDFHHFMKDKPDYAILGICLGMQTMNVASGGTMVQDIPSEIYGVSTVEEILGLPDGMQHRNYLSDYYPEQEISTGQMHPLLIEEQAYEYLGIEDSIVSPFVLSSHHQALDILGDGIIVLARSVDGHVVEMIGHERYPHVLGFQFHPEVINLFTEPELLKTEASHAFHRELWATFGAFLYKK